MKNYMERAQQQLDISIYNTNHKDQSNSNISYLQDAVRMIIAHISAPEADASLLKSDEKLQDIPPMNPNQEKANEPKEISISPTYPVNKLCRS